MSKAKSENEKSIDLFATNVGFSTQRESDHNADDDPYLTSIQPLAQVVETADVLLGRRIGNYPLLERLG